MASRLSGENSALCLDVKPALRRRIHVDSPPDDALGGRYGFFNVFAGEMPGQIGYAGFRAAERLDVRSAHIEF